MRGRFVVAAVLSLSLSGCGWMVDLWSEHPVFGWWFQSSWPNGIDVREDKYVRAYMAVSRTCGDVRPGYQKDSFVSMRDYFLARVSMDPIIWGKGASTYKIFTDKISGNSALVVYERSDKIGGYKFLAKHVAKVDDLTVSHVSSNESNDPLLVLLNDNYARARLCDWKYEPGRKTLLNAF